MPNKIGDLNLNLIFYIPRLSLIVAINYKMHFNLYMQESKKDFEDEMPKMFETIHKVQMSGAQRSVYEVLGTELKNWQFIKKERKI